MDMFLKFLVVEVELLFCLYLLKDRFVLQSIMNNINIITERIYRLVLASFRRNSPVCKGSVTDYLKRENLGQNLNIRRKAVEGL